MRTLRVELGERSYPVHVGAGLLGTAHELVEMPGAAEKLALLIDDALVEQEGTRALIAGLGVSGKALHPSSVTGERSKDVARAAEIWSMLALQGFHRSDLLVTFGGGVVSDLGGFVAATYHRGMPWVAFPSTLLAMVDAAIGGKTGINLAQGKNLVGAFHQPLAVVADVTVLETLPDPVLRTGLAEVIKHGFIARPELIERVATDLDAIMRRDPATLEPLVADAAEVKVGIVSRDEHESGARAHLNYGHTLAHALEALSGYRALSHGEAVSIGMMFAANLSMQLGYADLVAEHRRVLERIGLPTTAPPFDFDAVAPTFSRDKKYAAGMRFVVLENIGEPVVVRDVPEAELRKAYEAIR